MVGQLPTSTTARGGRERHEHAVSRRVPAHYRDRPERGRPLMNFAREGLAFIVIAALIAAAAYPAALTRRSWPLWLLALVVTLVALWVAYFFRDPERTGSRGPQMVLARADGKVVMITEVDEPTFVHG